MHVATTSTSIASSLLWLIHYCGYLNDITSGPNYFIHALNRTNITGLESPADTSFSPIWYERIPQKGDRKTRHRDLAKLICNDDWDEVGWKGCWTLARRKKLPLRMQNEKVSDFHYHHLLARSWITHRINTRNQITHTAPILKQRSHQQLTYRLSTIKA